MNVFYQVCTSNKEEVKVEPQLEPKNSFSYSTEVIYIYIYIIDLCRPRSSKYPSFAAKGFNIIRP